MLDKETFYDLCMSSSVGRILDCVRSLSAGHVAYMNETRNTYRILVGNLLGNWHLDD
jgi:hypothetical protein